MNNLKRKKKKKREEKQDVPKNIIKMHVPSLDYIYM